MKAFGYEVGDAYELGVDQDGNEPLRLREISLNCSPVQLRVLAKFLLNCASLIEKHDHNFDHEHLRSWWNDWQPGFVDVIVVREQAEK